MDKRHAAAPARGQDLHARRRRDDVDTAAEARPSFGVAARSPPQELRTENEPRLAVEYDERAVGELLQLALVQPPALCMQAAVEFVGAGGACEGEEGSIVRVTALRARTVPGRKRRRIVEEEEARVAARRHRPTCPVATATLQTA